MTKANGKTKVIMEKMMDWLASYHRTNMRHHTRSVNLVSLVIVLLFYFSLLSCTTIAPKPPLTTASISKKERTTYLDRLQTWQIKGKISVQTARGSGSAMLNWQQSPTAYHLSLTGPLGIGSMQLTGRLKGGATMTTEKGSSFSAKSPETLLAQKWGYHLPVSYLIYWVRGLPVPNVPSQSKFDTQNRLVFLVQAGWQVEFQHYTKPVRAISLDMPDRIFISSPTLKSKMVIYNWRISLG